MFHKTIVILMLMPLTLSCFAGEIYKSIDVEGNVTYSSVKPINSTVVETVDEKKLLKRISVIKGASAQSAKVKEITKKLVDSRLERNKIRQAATQNYNDEISLIKKQRVSDLKNLSVDDKDLDYKHINSQQIRDSISRIVENQD